MSELSAQIVKEFIGLREAARELRQLVPLKKTQFLLNLASLLEKSAAAVLAANQIDLERLSPESPSAFRDRLLLDDKRIANMAQSLREVAELADPVSELVEERRLANGLLIKRVRAPLGVIFMIFESRPNVILEAFSLAFKSGNTIALRGGSESKETAKVIYGLMTQALKSSGLSERSFFGFDDYDRALVEKLLKASDLIDVVVPRGGDKLIEFVQNTARMPIIKNDRGLCHTFIDAEADLEMALQIVRNAKVQRPGVCNSLETVLVHEKVASQFLPRLYEATKNDGLKWHCDARTLACLAAAGADLDVVRVAIPSAWDTEYLALEMNCAVVDSLDSALSHIAKHGSRHSEAIVTANEAHARLFQTEVDAAAVYWNASTRFTDGFELGLGGELGISTQKLHVRGPVGLRELTTPRWIIDGSGQIRR